MSAKAQVAPVKWLDKAAAERVLEKRAQRVLGVSAAQFRKQLKAGKYRGAAVDHTPGVVELATICLFAGKQRARKQRRRSG